MALKSLSIKIIRVLILVIISIILLSAGYFYSQRGLIERLIVQTISEKTDNSVSVKKINLTFGGIFLDSISFKKNGIDVDAKSLMVRPNYDLLFSNFVLKLNLNQTYIDTLILTNTAVTINLDEINSLPKESKEDSLKTKQKSIEFDDKILEFIRSVSINNVNLKVIKDSSTFFKIDSINTSYSFDEDSQYKYRVTSDMYIENNEKKSKLEVLSNKVNESVEVNLILNHFNLTKPKVLKTIKGVKLYSGDIDGKIKLRVKNLKDYYLDGSLYISKVSGKFKDILVKDLQANAILEEKNITIADLIVKSGSSTIFGDGNYNIATQKYSAKVSEKGKINKNIWAVQLADSIKNKLSDIKGDYCYSVVANNRGVNASVSLKKLQYSNIAKLNEINLKLNTDFKKVNGDISLKDKSLNGKFSTDFDIKTKDIKLNGNLDVKGYSANINGKKLVVYSNLKKVSLNGKKINFAGVLDSLKYDSINYLKNSVNIFAKKIGNRTKIAINDSTKIDIVGKKGNYDISGNLKNSLWHDDINIPIEALKPYNSDFNFKTKVFKQKEKLSWDGQFVLDFENQESTLSGNLGFNCLGNVSNGHQYIKLEGWSSNFVNYSKKTIKPKLNIEIVDTTIKVKNFSVEDDKVVLTGEFTKNNLNGKITFDNYNLDLNSVNKIPIKAKIKGNSFIRGSLNSPTIRTLVNVSKFSVSNNGDFSVDLDLLYENKILKSMKDILYENKGYSLGKITQLEYSDKLYLKANGTSIKLYQFNEDLTQSGIKGNISYRVDISGKTIDDLKGNIVVDGDDMVVENHTIDDLYTSLELKDAKLYLDELSLYNSEVKIKTTGVYPLKKEESDLMNFIVQIKGKILTEANKDIQLFPKIVSEQSLANIFITSKRKEVNLRGQIDLNFDSLYIPKVVTYVSNAKIKIDLKRGELSNIVGTGQIDEDSIWVNNYDYGEGKRYHLYIKPLDIDFGVIGLKTTENGIPFNFSSFQKEEDRGRVIPKGIDKFPVFSFSGPLQTPGLHGNLELKDTEFTFPGYDDGNGNGSYPTFLQLNLKLIVKENVFYYLALRKYLKDQEIIRTKLDKDGFVHIKGPVIVEKLNITGSLGASNNGKIFYGQDFSLEKARIEFVPSINQKNEINNIPIVALSAYTMMRDENGFPKKVDLTLKIKEEGSEYYMPSGRPGEVQFFIDDASSIDANEARRVSGIGSTTGTDVLDLIIEGDDEADSSITKQAAKRSIEIGEKYVFNTYLSNFLMAKVKIPYVDVISVNSKIFSNFYDLMENSDARADWGLLDGSSFEIGSFVTDRFYLNYKGTIENDEKENSVFVSHSTAVEYALNRMVQLQIGFKYDPIKYDNSASVFYGVMFNIPFGL